jgi:hypothetical protein
MNDSGGANRRSTVEAPSSVPIDVDVFATVEVVATDEVAVPMDVDGVPTGTLAVVSSAGTSLPPHAATLTATNTTSVHQQRISSLHRTLSLECPGLTRDQSHLRPQPALRGEVL